MNFIPPKLLKQIASELGWEEDLERLFAMLCETEQLVFIEYHGRTNGATTVDNNLVDKAVNFHSSH